MNGKIQLYSQKVDKIISSENKAFTEKCIRSVQNISVKTDKITNWYEFWAKIDYLISLKRFAFSLNEDNEYNLIWVKMIDDTWQVFHTIIPNYNDEHQFLCIKFFNKLKIIDDKEYKKLSDLLVKDRL